MWTAKCGRTLRLGSASMAGSRGLLKVLETGLFGSQLGGQDRPEGSRRQIKAVKRVAGDANCSET